VRAINGPKDEPAEIVARALDGSKPARRSDLADDDAPVKRELSASAELSAQRARDRAANFDGPGMTTPRFPPRTGTRTRKIAMAAFGSQASRRFLVSLDATMLYAAFGALRGGFPRQARTLSWVLNAYTVVYAATLIPAGGLADTYGRKRVFLLGVTLFVAASVACGSRASVPALIGARIVQAVGARCSRRVAVDRHRRISAGASAR
jgi:hypothetical protein